MAARREFRILGMTPGEIWRGFVATTTGKIALVFFSVMVAFSVYALVTLPPNFGNLWNTPSYWQANPKYAPPAWINLFTGNAYAPQIVIRDFNFTSGSSGGVGYAVVQFAVDEQYASPWRNLYMVVKNPAVYNASTVAYLTVERPDGKAIQLGPISVNSQFVALGLSPQVISQINSFYQSNFGVQNAVPAGSSAIPYLFFTVKGGDLVPLKGTYKFTITIYSFSGGNVIDRKDLRIILEGQVYGLMGTDFLGHDLWLGLLAGFPIDLAVGILTAA
ncbi:MAG: ABC transporter permease, partial [Thermoproteus sp.]